MHLPIRLALPLLMLAAARGYAERDPGEALERARANLQSMTRRLAKYACLETVDRIYYEPPPDPPAPLSCSQIEAARSRRAAPLAIQATDRLRLEVTVSEGQEIHAWPGATRFDTRDVDEIIHQGPIGTGSFGTHLIGVFDNPGVDFHYVGEKTDGDRKVLEYSYRVPAEASRYRVKTGSTWQVVPYSGAFWLDADSLELRRFTVEASPLPSGSFMCQLHSALDYQRVRIGDGDVLLPREGQLAIVMDNALETSNVTTFSDCREYQAESALRFDSNSDVDGASARPVVRTPVALPIGLPVELALEAPIDTGTAAAGDPISAKVVKPVRRPGSGEILIPAGATVRGRITRMERHVLPRPYFLVSISFNRLVRGDISSPFAAKYDGSENLARDLGAELRLPGRGLEFWDVGTFLFPSNKPKYVLPAGWESKWETLATPSR
jgi:hypothetical protein